MFKPLMLLISALLISFNLYAKDLSKQEVENWISAAPTISQWLNKHKSILNDEEKIDFLESSPTEISAYASKILKKHNLDKQLKTQLSQYGFNDLNRFFEVQAQVLQAYFAVSMQQANVPTSISEELQQSLKEIDKTEGLTAEQKQQMKDQLMQIMGQVSKMQSASKSTADQATIKPYLDKINSALQTFE
ncbi:hypothetical protein N7931_14555 [Catenovulum sp. 2E275]|uniref:hypothetical protein n=1 Tax=Catenovulum sp. 2E275 TaxID=2980497 RepID=UPI0021D383A9|nr:hypothetical protein [Catenovulum sp. 2E275]MCU4676851.1 hypothetical protein [Catenovulum sp. 2E275]